MILWFARALVSAIRTALLSICLLGVFPAYLHAADIEEPQGPKLTELSLEQLGDIEVTTVSKQPEEVWRTAVAVYVITQDDIRRSGSTSIPEVLRLAPGVEVARIDSDHWAVGVRGFGDQFSKSLLVMIDGRSIYSPLFAGMYWPAHDTLLEDVERIEVIRGPGGTIWGANAVNGVINIITKSAGATHGALMSASGGTLDRGAAAFRYGGGNGSTFDYRVYGKGINRGAESHPDGATYDEWWTSQVGFRTDWTVATGNALTVQGDFSRGSHGQQVSVASFSPPAQTSVNGPLAATGVNLQARWQRDFSSNAGLRVQGYYDRTVWLAPHFGETRNTVDVDFVSHLTVARRHALTAGAGARRSPSRFTQAVPALDFSPRNETDSIYSGFAQDEIQLVRNHVWLTAGSKIEHNNYTGVEVQPGARLLWTPRTGHSLWTAVTRAVRTPSRIEEGFLSTNFVGYSSGIPVFLRIIGNRDFDAERLLGYEAGYRTRLASRAYVDVAAFHNHHQGLGSFGLGAVSLEATPLPAHAVVALAYVNGVNGSSNGFEVAPDWQLTRWWQIKGSYSYVRLDLNLTPGSIDVNAVSRYEGASPTHQTRIQSRTNLPHGAEVDLAYRYVSALPALTVGAYHTADARLGWQVAPGLDVSVAGQNLLQPSHVEFSHSPPPAIGISRSAFVGFTWRRTRP